MKKDYLRSSSAAVTTLKKLAHPVSAKGAARFFKTGPGEYGEGDRFLGVSVPALRALLPACREMPVAEITRLLHSPLHECRLLALLLLTKRFLQGEEDQQRSIYRLYLAHTRLINNWDLVDSSAPAIVGGWLLNRDRRPLTRLARSGNLWERRIAIIATLHFIRENDLTTTEVIAERLLTDREDLIQKATGWMLREAGKRNLDFLLSFLNRHHSSMPRTMLRYAIERLPEGLRQDYLKRS